jgi:hypothetical protein
MELDYAVRLLFSEHGVIIKKTRFPDRQGRRVTGENENRQNPPQEAPAGGEAPKKRRRRRRHAPRKENPQQ